MHYIIDRIEGAFAICECPNTEHIRIPVQKLPDSAREGDVLRRSCDGYIIDKNATDARYSQNAAKLSDLLKKRN
jgi:hypothetical protein